MFTGVITHTATVKATKKTDEGLLITFARPAGWRDLALGESVATDGVCLTVAAIRDDEYDCLAMPETLARSTFGQQMPTIVNLERALQAQDRFSGHFVQGHVDGLGVVTAISKVDGHLATVRFEATARPLVVYKGSIAVNGVSLTVASVDDNRLAIALIPYTLQHTTLGSLRVGSQVNLEFDPIAKYVVNAVKLGQTNATS